MREEIIEASTGNSTSDQDQAAIGWRVMKAYAKIGLIVAGITCYMAGEHPGLEISSLSLGGNPCSRFDIRVSNFEQDHAVSLVICFSSCRPSRARSVKIAMLWPL
jgi:hypothetical protein